MINVDDRFRTLSCAVVKLTSRCNIRCAYCYEDIRNNGADMTAATFQALVDKIFLSSKQPSVQFILHGGEPTILSTEWFAETLEFAEVAAKRHRKAIKLSIQSNLIKISDAKLDLFKRHSVTIGGSIDSPDLLAPALRPMASTAVETFLQARRHGLRVGVLTTINASNAQHMGRFCNWLLREMDVSDFKANVAYPVGAGINLQVPRADLIFAAQRDIIEFMMNSDGALIEDNLADEIIRYCENVLAGLPRHTTLCHDLRCGAGSRVIGVGADGTIYPCGRFAWSEHQRSLGTLHQEQTTTDFFERVDAFHGLNPENWEHCNTCEARNMCNFGCQAFIVRSKINKNIECDPTKLRFQYYRQNPERIQRLYEIICERKKRSALSQLGQKISRLKQLVPKELLPLVRDELQQTLGRASATVAAS